MSKEDVEKAVKEAEQFAAEDAKRKEEVDTRNQADQMVYQSEKAMEEMKDKLVASEAVSYTHLDVYKRQVSGRTAQQFINYMAGSPPSEAKG